MQGDSREPVADATFVEATSQELISLLMTGNAALAENAAAERVTPYLFGISGHGDGPGFQAGLIRTLAWLGERIARPLGDVLLECKARGVTLVLCGPIAATPIHAAPWRSDHGDRCLVDLIDIRHAPSALIATTAQRRAKARQAAPPRLVALGDPERSHPKRKLPAAGPEVEEIAAMFADSSCAVGADADRDFLRQHLENATHLHLACHAHGGLFDSSETAIFLASGALPATALTALGEMATRLVVVSACQSAISEIAGLPEEALSIATVMLAAGSACAIASLWEVDDLATALLMTKLYEEMLISGHRPPEALRRAQLWLRNLSEEDESRFFERHPALEAEFSRRASTGEVPGQRGSSPGHPGSGPYTHPEFWAPFIAVGS
jgi:CHAT domain-containing protein